MTKPMDMHSVLTLLRDIAKLAREENDCEGGGLVCIDPTELEAVASFLEWLYCSPVQMAIASERYRQIMVEGWTPEHDDSHDAGELCGSGAAYALNASCVLHPMNGDPLESPFAHGWCFNEEWWKPKTPRRDLVRAAALIIAELERMDRQEAREEAQRAR